MNEGMVAVFIPIVLAIITGLVIVVFIYFRSRERQLLIEKGLSAESIKEFFESKRDPYTLLKIGIISVMFGASLGLGLMLEDSTSKEYYVPLMIFVGTGLGFIIANLVSRRLNKKESVI